ncbi:MAG: hypothetical protein ACR2PH_10335 [Desulfobulbia bacterium]
MQVSVVPAVFKNGRISNQPFSEMPPWLRTALEIGLIGVIRTDEDHAILAIKTNQGIAVGEPGDKINNDLMYGLVVSKKRGNVRTWEQIEKMLKLREQAAQAQAKSE